MVVKYNSSVVFKVTFTDNDKLIYVDGSTQKLSKKMYDIKNTTSSPLYKYIHEHYKGNYDKCIITPIETYNAVDKYDLENKVLEYVLKYKDEGYTLINDIQTNIDKTVKDKYDLWKRKQIEKLGNEDIFKQNRNDYQKQYYNNTFKKPDIIVKKEKKELPLLQKYKNIDLTKYTKTPNFSETTIKQYTMIIKKIYLFYNKKDIDENNEIFKYLNNLKYKSILISKTFNFLKKNINDFIKQFPQYINSIYSIFIHINGFKVMLKQLAPYKDYINEEYYKHRNDNKPSEDVIKKVSFVKEDILKLLNENANLNNKYKLIFGLYSLLPIKRPNDYRIIKIINTDPELDDNIDKNYNYIYKNPDGVVKMYFYKMKVHKNKVLIVNLPSELSDYIDFNKSYLFQYKDGSYNSGMSKLITNAFKKIYNYPYNPTMIRKLYTTYIKDMNINDKKEIANIMNHSLEQQLLYSYK